MPMSGAGPKLPDSPAELAATTRPLNDIALLIPAWQPEPTFPALVAVLARHGFGVVVVVDDGSADRFSPLFAEIANLPGVQVLRHAVNLGKGRALKTGFNYLLTVHPQLRGVVTADADGQHTSADIAQVARVLQSSGSQAVLGARGFERDVPIRSRVGNALTRRVFGFLTGVRLRDTQTGLRGLPFAILSELLPLDGERYEYEMTMLAHLCRHGRPPIEIPIATVYIDNNRGSHFDPAWDSIRIYFVLIRFYASALLAACLDFAGFAVTFVLTHSVLLSVAAGRISSLVNYAVNRRFVFHSRSSVAGSLWRYYLLVVVVAAASYGLINTLQRYAHWNVFAAKVTVDVLLSLVTFSAQRTFVFRREGPL